ncbi:MAG: hypothetical protein MSIBF_02580 [Candidatus Altiarchaeales archaeon IMC4]|nr:MAG: hypothetical protein MSIBF_02580 [Candidatus Altiarchaeales archaeon IMC4]
MAIFGWLEKRPALAWNLAVLYAGAIFLFSAMPIPPQPPIGFDITKIEHALEYFIFAILLITALRGKNPVGYYPVVLAVLIAALYGISDEVHQFFVPGRCMSIYDVLADWAGAFIAAFIHKRL